MIENASAGQEPPVKPRKRSQDLRNEIRRLLRLRLCYDEVMLQLRLPRSTFYRHLEAIRLEDREWLPQDAKIDFTSHFRRCLEGLDDQARVLMAAQEQATKLRDKISASKAICDIEMATVDLRTCGPTAIRMSESFRDKTVKVSGITKMLSSQLQADGSQKSP
ncbi:MAG: hypothetical protein ABSB26_06980 [Nitrososphaerales archaeon]